MTIEMAGGVWFICEGRVIREGREGREGRMIRGGAPRVGARSPQMIREGREGREGRMIREGREGREGRSGQYSTAMQSCHTAAIIWAAAAQASGRGR
jgi:hypothetical protein